MICPISKPTQEQVKKGALVISIGVTIGAVAHYGYKYYMKRYGGSKPSTDGIVETKEISQQ